VRQIESEFVGLMLDVARKPESTGEREADHGCDQQQPRQPPDPRDR
jgi:hypothetical protein